MLAYEDVPGMVTDSVAFRKARDTVARGIFNKAKKAKIADDRQGTNIF